MLERLEAERRGAANAALGAQERERERIARDLHDEVNQALTALLLRLEAVRRQTDDPETATELAEIGAVISRAMRELLDLARGLRPTTLDDLGLKAALATLVEEIEREAGIQASFEVEGDIDELSDEVQLVTYRVAQEAVTNVDPARRGRALRSAADREPAMASSCGSETTARDSTRRAPARASGSPGCASAPCSSAASWRSNRSPARARG